MAQQKKVLLKYGIKFKEHVVNEIESGLSIKDARRKYRINGSYTIQRWMK
jgi:hypothetical protein